MDRAGERTQRLAVLAVVLAALGMFFGTAQSGGADEPANQATAWYVTAHVLPPRHDSVVDVGGIPGSAVVTPCYTTTRGSAACLPARDDQAEVRSTNVFNKPPVYYWVVGAGQRLVRLVDDRYVDLGGRLASLVFNVLTLWFLARRLRRVTAHWGTFLLLCLTPMACFYWAVVNPSGWEVSMGLAFALALAMAWWKPAADGGARRETVMLTSISVLFALARPNDFVWIVVIAAVVLLARPHDVPAPTGPTRRRVFLAVGSGVLTGIAWTVAFPSRLARINQFYVEHPAVKEYGKWFYRSLESLPTRVQQLFDGIGWLDTPMPKPMYVVTIVVWLAVFGHVFGSRPDLRRAIVATAVAITVLPSVMETVGFNTWPYWWSGRYTLPLAAALVLVLLLRAGAAIPGALRALSLVAVADLATMVWVNFLRYAKAPGSYLPTAHLEAEGWRIVGVALSLVGLVGVWAVTALDTWRSRTRLSSELVEGDRVP